MSDKNKVIDHILNFTPPAKTDAPAPEKAGREAIEQERQSPLVVSRLILDNHSLTVAAQKPLLVDTTLEPSDRTGHA